MNEVKEPQINWGGSWTELKLDAFENYVNAYLTIMSAQKQKFSGWPTTIYFDGFAGSGERFSTIEEEKDLFSDYFIKEDLELYKGSAERVLSLNQKFDHYYFVDNNKKAIDKLKQKLSNSNLIRINCNFITDNVNNQLINLSKILNSQNAALVLLDPFGMQIDWSSIEILKDKRVDLWILIPSGVIINRFLDRKGKLNFSNKLQSYFGLSEDKIRERFYETEKVDTLFGSGDEIKKTNDSVSNIAELYIEKLSNIWNHVSQKPLQLFNTKNVPIYHFVFASNNKTALKVADQIIEQKNK
ncbi:MAG: three-Cys-motif partner protein TcmP [Ignavibacteriota bacterium]|jgi:three-Cys-motif partner protein|nr:MAG: three-Cys-motif partner protein TcmP [Chlorobiota bacterium]MBE7476301.1 three-Cys-motif partner protein TcmP [Ignavibacteriales bacterium]MBL1124217.1 three-Cys-motif partner protein TcmP [Ignavibacteriota bacterium]MCC7094408.1 three-Cys-motif partner protein TcmP [Ignavibacteriaceae bacterium]MCE7857563.1 three-Cys-motif partner protein TcmP [Ignavibacteria bacterium CHB3]